MGSPHPLLSPSVIPLPFSWLTLFGHVTAAIAGGEREGKGEWRKDGQIVLFFLLFSPSQNKELRSGVKSEERQNSEGGATDGQRF